MFSVNHAEATERIMITFCVQTEYELTETSRQQNWLSNPSLKNASLSKSATAWTLSNVLSAFKTGRAMVNVFSPANTSYSTNIKYFCI